MTSELNKTDLLDWVNLESDWKYFSNLFVHTLEIHMVCGFKHISTYMMEFKWKLFERKVTEIPNFVMFRSKQNCLRNDNTKYWTYYFISVVNMIVAGNQHDLYHY